MSKIIYINLGDLRLPTFQAHKQVNPEYIQEIADSIKTLGVIEPLIVRDTDQGIEIVAGCVRYQAARLAGLQAVPCINMSLDSKAAEVLKLHENIKRIPLDHVDQGYTFLMMMETFNMTEHTIADSVGKSIAYVSQHISLVRLGADLIDAVRSGGISFSQSRELMRVSDIPERRRLLNFCQNDGATVDVLRRWIQDYLRSTDISPPRADSESGPTTSLQAPDVSRNCRACGKSVDISKICQVFLCQVCCDAILNALDEENARRSQNSEVIIPKDAPG